MPLPLAIADIANLSENRGVAQVQESAVLMANRAV